MRKERKRKEKGRRKVKMRRGRERGKKKEGGREGKCTSGYRNVQKTKLKQRSLGSKKREKRKG